jgi:hypothetical protein
MQFSPLQLLLFQKKIKELGYRKASEKCGIPVSLISYIRRNADRSYEEDTINKIAFLLDMKPYFFRYLEDIDMQSFSNNPQQEIRKLVDTFEKSYQLVYEAVKPTTRPRLRRTRRR